MIYLVTNQARTNQKTYSLKDLAEFVFNNPVQLGLDTETEGALDYRNRLLSIQIGNKHDQYVIEYQTLSAEDRRYLSKIMGNYEGIWILHNAKFDIQFLWLSGIYIKKVHCTLLAETLLYAGHEKLKGYLSLYQVCKRYCHHRLDKSVRGNIRKEGFTNAVIKYAAEDVEYLIPIREAQLKRITHHRLNKVLELENRAVFPFAMIEFTGVAVALDKLEDVKFKLFKELEGKKEIILDELEHLNLEEYIDISPNLFNPNVRELKTNLASPQQLLQLVNEVVEVDDTSERELSKHKKEVPLIAKILDYKKTNSLSTKFGTKLRGFINPNTGRIHPSIWQVLSTGRISMKHPNLQQIPSKGKSGKLIRSVIVPKPRYKFVQIDYGQCELRILAALCGDPTMLKVFNEDGIDLHSYLCAATFNIPIEDVRKPFPFKPDITYRDVQKTLNFGIVYGMGAHKLADSIGVTVKQAEDILAQFIAAMPVMTKFLEDCARIGMKHFLMKSAPLGRIRFFEKTNDFKELQAIGRKSKNMPMQGGNADMTKLALIYIYEYIVKHDLPVRIVLQIHDEIICEVPEHLAEEWKVIQADLMMKAADKILLNKVPMKVDAEITDYWKK